MTQLQALGRNPLAIGIVAYLLTSVPVVIGVAFSLECVTIPTKPASAPRPDLLTACSRFDGRHYGQIVDRGYRYRENQRSLVAFFPGYPLAGRFVIFFTEWSATLALLVASNVMLIGAFAMTAAFLQARWPEAAPNDRHLVLALLGVFPATLYFRMTYSESMFLFCLAIFSNGAARRWSLLPLAFVAGVATAIRPVGVACTAAFLWQVLSDSTLGSKPRRAFLALIYLPFASWGLLAYMGYQEAAFGNPLAFAQTQENWSYASPKGPDLLNDNDKFWDKAECLLTAEPILSVYDANSRRYWRIRQHFACPLFGIYYWNPIIFVASFLLIVFGAFRSWLSGPETVLGLCLLAIPYMTRAYEMSMLSHARFAAVVIPAYLVVGKMMRPLPQPVVWAVLGVFSAMLMIWSAMFAAEYDFI